VKLQEGSQLYWYNLFIWVYNNTTTVSAPLPRHLMEEGFLYMPLIGPKMN
jgi:hypothetical protein